jgi:hypothetical protein
MLRRYYYILTKYNSYRRLSMWQSIVKKQVRYNRDITIRRKAQLFPNLSIRKKDQNLEQPFLGTMSLSYIVFW